MRECSECHSDIEHRAPDAKTCGAKCARRRDYRLRKVKKRPVPATVGELVYNNSDRIARKMVESELLPIIREAVDDNVMEAVAQLVRLTPRAVALLSAQMCDPNPTISQRAAQTIIKYTIGHPALVQPPDKVPPQMEVHFNLPRPEAPDAPPDAETVTSRACDTCGEIKTEDQFESGSDRCTTCFAEWKAKVAELAA